MATLRETCTIVNNLSTLMNTVLGELERFQLSIVHYQFDNDLWEHSNINYQTEMQRLMNQYANAFGRDESLIAQYNLFHVFWYNLTDLYARETAQWVVDHVKFIDEHIPMCMAMILIFNQDLTRLNRMLRADQRI